MQQNRHYLSTVVSYIFAIALTVSEILTFKIYFENVGQDDEVQLSPWRHSMLNIRLYYLHPFAVSFSIYEILANQTKCNKIYIRN